MASTTAWKEYNDPSGTGITEVSAAACNWQNADAYQPTVGSLAPIAAGGQSFHKIQALLFTAGAADAHVYGLSYYISNAGSSTPATTSPFWEVFAAVPASGTFYAQPSSSVLATVGGSSMAQMATASGTLNGTWGDATAPTGHTPTHGPFCATAGAGSSGTPVTITASTSLYATALYTQLITKTGASAGSIGSLTITATWTES